MSIVRSYFEKCNILIKDNATNNSQNPVHELFYGTPDSSFSRYIFKIDLTDLKARITGETISQEQITKHELNITNTIAVRSDLIGKAMSDGITRRASSFTVELFKLTEDWDEGSGYEFVYTTGQFADYTIGASNYFDRKTGISWSQLGAYVTGNTIATQHFDKGNENVKIDITDYINDILFSGSTNYGLGLKFTDDLEVLETEDRYSVGFHGKYTHTYFEPFVETSINTIILDDRKFFYLDKENSLYLYSKKGANFNDITVNYVSIYDYRDQLMGVITGNNISRVKTGIYKINLTIESDTYPDAVIFRDVWNITDNNGRTKDIEQNFYLRSAEEYYKFNETTHFHPENIHLSLIGISSGERVKRGAKRRVIVDYKQYYETEDAPLDIEYRLYTKQGGNVDINVIDFTKVDRMLDKYEFLLDTSWLIPQEYYLELKILNNGVFIVHAPIKFRVQSEIQNFTVV